MGKKGRVCKNYDALQKIKMRAKEKPSKKFQKAIEYFKLREDIIYERMLAYEKNGNKVIIAKENALKELRDSIYKDNLNDLKKFLEFRHWDKEYILRMIDDLEKEKDSTFQQ